MAVRVWRLRARDVPAALARVPRTTRALRRTPGVRFAKVLGTGDGRTFRARDADLTRWAVVSVHDGDDVPGHAHATAQALQPWCHAAVEEWSAWLHPIASRGRWSGAEPFGSPVPRRPPDGPVVALTRARLRPARALAFWRAVPPVSADLHRTDGLRLAVGVGEAPLGLQGTLSVWRDARALAAFASRGAAHQHVVAQTARLDWYAEELFARFRPLASSGTVDGVDPLPGVPAEPAAVQRHGDAAPRGATA